MESMSGVVKDSLRKAKEKEKEAQSVLRVQGVLGKGLDTRGWREYV
jgi:hypothetical protein